MHSNRLHVTTIFAILVSLFTSTVSTTKAAPEPAGWQMIGQAGGPTQGIAVQGSYAYIGVGPRLVVVDISEPANPRQVGASAVFDDLVQGVAVSGGYAYAAAGSAGLYVVDVTAPAALRIVGRFDSSGFAEGVAVAGTAAYLADGPTACAWWMLPMPPRRSRLPAPST